MHISRLEGCIPRIEQKKMFDNQKIKKKISLIFDLFRFVLGELRPNLGSRGKNHREMQMSRLEVEIPTIKHFKCICTGPQFRSPAELLEMRPNCSYTL